MHVPESNCFSDLIQRPEWTLARIGHGDIMASKMANFAYHQVAALFRTLLDRLSNLVAIWFWALAFAIRHFQTLCRHYFSGEPVVIGITMYVLSISSVEEVQMVLTLSLFSKFQISILTNSTNKSLKILTSFISSRPKITHKL